MNNQKIYRTPVIEQILKYYGDILLPKPNQSIHSHLEEISQHLYQGLLLQKEFLYTEINNYHSEFLGVSSDKLKKEIFSIEDCRKAISSQYGFSSWEAVKELDRESYDMSFENCIASILKGDLSKLKSAITDQPQLVQQHSKYGHSASLLHYAASNGFELWRQQVPLNLLEVVQLLISLGASPKAKMKVYGGEFTPWQLLATSAHPKDAGIDLHSIQRLLT